MKSPMPESRDYDRFSCRGVRAMNRVWVVGLRKSWMIDGTALSGAYYCLYIPSSVVPSLHLMTAISRNLRPDLESPLLQRRSLVTAAQSADRSKRLR